MKIIHTLHVAEHINNESDLISAYKLLEQNAHSLGLMIIANAGVFNLYKIGKPSNESCVFEGKNIDGVRQYLASIEK